MGDFRVEGLTAMSEPNEILCRMRLDLDGILEVTAVEKRTGKSRHVTIDNAMRERSAEEIAAGRKRIQQLYESRSDMEDAWGTDTGRPPALSSVTPGTEVDTATVPVGAAGSDEVRELMARARRLLGQMHEDDREEAIDLIEQIEDALASGDAGVAHHASQALKELLFFVEGQQ